MRRMMGVHEDFRTTIENIRKKLKEQNNIDIPYTEITKALSEVAKEVDFNIFENNNRRKKGRKLIIEL